MMMKEKYFICKLISDVVLNASLATEGNMETLDYIPGSNFLGIVAAALYPKMQGKEDEVYDLFHSNRVSYGDAVISDESHYIFYPKPFTYFKDKLDEDKNIYLHHLLDQEKGVVNEQGKKIQMKQERSGFLNHEGKVIHKIKKTFALKSAQDRDTRSSKEGHIFGFESIKAGQVFIFSIRYQAEKDIEIIKKYLEGTKYVGKSKSAQYGRVSIAEINALNSIATFWSETDTLIYAESNLCFIDENTGQSTYQPTVEQLGLKSGEINWEKSSIRTYTYSPWNFKRNASNTQRNCIAKGSVFYIEKGILNNVSTNNVGEYQAEGLGRIIYNPIFLKGRADGTLDFLIKSDYSQLRSKKETPKPVKENIKTSLGNALYKIHTEKEKEKEIARSIIKAIGDKTKDWDLKSNVTSSQWGNIRALATEYVKKGGSYNAFLKELGYEENQGDKIITNKTGLLTHGKMFDKLWDKNNRLNKFKIILDDPSNQSLLFVAKYSAEMAKIYIDIKNGKIKKDDK